MALQGVERRDKRCLSGFHGGRLFKWSGAVPSNAAWFLEHGAEGAFGVRRLVAAMEIGILARPGSLLPGIPRTGIRPCSPGVSGTQGGKPPGAAADQWPLAETSRRTQERPSGADSIRSIQKLCGIGRPARAPKAGSQASEGRRIRPLTQNSTMRAFRDP
jgi:hypothetical protein